VVSLETDLLKSTSKDKGISASDFSLTTGQEARTGISH